MNMLSETINPLDRVTLATIVKITGSEVFHHEAGGEPYVQISVDALAFDGLGDVISAHIEDSADHGDEDRVNELMSIYTPGSLYWVEGNVFSLMEGEVYFYHPLVIKPVATIDADAINALFTRRSSGNCEPEEQTDRREKPASSLSDHDITVISGTLEHLRTVVTRSGQKMAFARLKDKKSYIDLVVFPHIHREYEKALSAGNPVTMTGRLDVSGETSYFIPEQFDLPVNGPPSFRPSMTSRQG